MKILLVHNHYIFPGGEDEVVASEKRLLIEKGHEVRLYTKTNQSLEGQSFVEKAKYFLQFGRIDKKIYYDLLKILQEFQPDVIHIHNPFFMIGGAVYEAAIKEKVPVVQTLHNYRLLCPVGTFFRDGRACEDCLQKGFTQTIIHRCWKKSFIHSFFLSRYVSELKHNQNIVQKINKIILTSRFSLKKYEDAGFSRDKLVFKPNFLDCDAQERNTIGDYALFIGALVDYKGIELLLKIWVDQKIQHPLKVVGTGPMGNILKEKYKRENIEFLGQKNQEDVIKVLQGARCLVVPSICYETSSRVIVEAFACGVPVIASNIGSFTSIVDHEINGLHFNPYMPMELKQALDAVFVNISCANKMGQMARKKFLEQYSKEKNYRQLMSIYKSVLAHEN